MDRQNIIRLCFSCASCRPASFLPVLSNEYRNALGGDVGFAERRPLTLFVVLSVLIVCAVMAAFISISATNPQAAAAMQEFWAWLQLNELYPNIASIIAFSVDTPVFFLVLVFAGAPTIAAVATAFLGGRLGELNSRVRLWSKSVSGARGLSVYLGLAVLFLAGVFSHLWAVAHYGAPGDYQRAIAHLGGSSLSVVPLALLGALIDEGGSLEELGWRGFALPLLQERYAPLVATLVLGTIWWAWHLPRELPSLLSGSDLTKFLQLQSVFLLLCVSLSVLMTYAVNLTGGSVWPAVFIHGGTNVWSKAIGGPDLGIPFSLRDVVVVLAAAAVVLIVGPGLGRSAADAQDG